MDPSGEPSVGYMTIKPEMKMNIYEPRQEKTCPWGLRPVKTQNWPAQLQRLAEY